MGRIIIKYIIASICFALITGCSMRIETETENKPVTFRSPTVSECKSAVDIAQQSAMLISFEKGHKMDYIKRIWELTENPIERMYAQRVGDFLVISHAQVNAKEPDIKQIKEHIDTFSEYCNSFELK